jgi:hypothetical protein
MVIAEIQKVMVTRLEMSVRIVTDYGLDGRS